jgi:hypothetical protein
LAGALLLKEAGQSVTGIVSAPDQRLAANTSETYLGYSRGSGLISAVKPVADAPADYVPARVPGNGEWTLSGKWTIRGEYLQAMGEGSLRLGFDAKDVYLVVEPVSGGGSIAVSLDGAWPAEASDLTKGVLVPEIGRLYHIVSLESAAPHVLKLDVKGSLRLFAFTFG